MLLHTQPPTISTSTIRPIRRRTICTVARAKEPHHRQCARHVVEHHVTSNSVIAVGSGPLINYIIDDIGARLKEQSLSNVAIIPTNDVAASEAAFHGVPQTTLAQCQRHVDVFIEQADEVDCACGELPFVAGRAAEPVQPSLHRMRVLAAAAEQTVVVLDDIGCVKERLGRELPVAIQAEGWEETAEELDDEFLGDAEIWCVCTRHRVHSSDNACCDRMRPSEPSPTAGPRGGSRPYVSPEGHSIVDIRFYGDMKLYGDGNASYAAIAKEIDSVEGVVAHGLFADAKPVAAVVAMPQGEPLVLVQGERITSSMANE